ncbi:MAG: AtpZ/AtpI family protein [Anaerolineae bacterium]|nr:AtpZ/AtpI family protein [Anaerolineae bacterium]
MSEQKQSGTAGSVRDTVWVLGVGSQAGVMLAAPVLLGLLAGYFLDKLLGTLPLFTLVFVLIGMIGGPIIVYRMVTRAVKSHLEQGKDDDANQV